MRKIINNLWFLLICMSLMTWVESCKCNKPTEKKCPTCEIKGQICENYICRCPDGEEVVGQYCTKIDRNNPNIIHWKSVLTNGNCMDSVLCSWYIDPHWIDTGNVSVGGNTSLNFTYYGSQVDKYYQAANLGNATVKVTPNGYIIKSTSTCHFPCFSAVKTEGFTNLSQDTLWCHFTIVDCYFPTTTNFGEFDQIFVKY